MKKIILALASLTVLVGQAFAAGVLINGNQINPQTKISIASETVTGNAGLTVTQITAMSSATVGGTTINSAGAIALAASQALTASGANGNVVSASSITTTGGLFGGSLSVGGTTINGSGALTLASGQSITVAGANGYVLGSSSFSTTGGIFGASLRVTGQASGIQCAHFDASGNLTGTGSDCASSAGFASIATGATAGGTTRWATATSISTGAFTDNGTTVTAPSGTSLFMNTGSTTTFMETNITTTTRIDGLTMTTPGAAGQFGPLPGSTITWTSVKGEPVNICMDATMGTTNGGAEWIIATVTCNGSYLPGYSSTVGISSNYYPATLEDSHVYWCRPFNPVVGSNTCLLFFTSQASTGYVLEFNGGSSTKVISNFFVQKR